MENTDPAFEKALTETRVGYREALDRLANDDAPSAESDALTERVKAVLDEHTVMVTFDHEPPTAITVCSCGFKDTLMGTEPNEHLAGQIAACVIPPGVGE